MAKYMLEYFPDLGPQLGVRSFSSASAQAPRCLSMVKLESRYLFALIWFLC